MRYQLTGKITISYSYKINAIIEGNDEDDAIDGLLSALEPSEAFASDTDMDSLSVAIIPDSEPLIGMPMLPGFDSPA